MTTWLHPITRPALASRHRLVCFPYAGAGPSIFNAWKAHLPQNIEALAVHLPGRERRFSEPALTDLRVIVESITSAIEELPSCPFTLFGHSLGAMIAYEVACALESSGKQPHLLIASGRHCPGTPSKTKAVSHLPDAEFVQAIAKYGGMSSEILACQELLEILIPTIRADFHLSEHYKASASTSRLNTPLLVLGSKEDELVDFDQLTKWQSLSASSVNIHEFEGGHFFLQKEFPRIIELFTSHIDGPTNRPSYETLQPISSFR